MMISQRNFKIGVVGPCGSGKSTLAERLRQLGYNVRHIAQEHSYVPTMWKRITNPTVLIYLVSSFEISTQRRKLNWTINEFQIQLNRLSNAREHADLVIYTDQLNKEQVFENALEFLNQLPGEMLD